MLGTRLPLTLLCHSGAPRTCFSYRPLSFAILTHEYKPLRRAIGLQIDPCLTMFKHHELITSITDIFHHHAIFLRAFRAVFNQLPALFNTRGYRALQQKRVYRCSWCRLAIGACQRHGVAIIIMSMSCLI